MVLYGGFDHKYVSFSHILFDFYDRTVNNNIICYDFKLWSIASSPYKTFLVKIRHTLIRFETNPGSEAGPAPNFIHG